MAAPHCRSARQSGTLGSAVNPRRPSRSKNYGRTVTTDDELDALRPVTIVDGVVTRPAAASSPTVHAFLRYVREQGVTSAPEPIGIEGGLERLVAIEGDSGADGWRPTHSEAGLRSAARLLRALHDASIGWTPPDDAVFGAPEVPAMPEERVWCHGDVGPWNMVWQGDEAVGLIDWDFLHGGPRLDDVAYALQWFVPARNDEMALTWHHFAQVPDRAARVRIFVDEYGDLPAFDIAETIASRMEATMAIELSLARDGVEPQRTWVADGSQQRAAREARWVREHARLLEPDWSTSELRPPGRRSKRQ